MKRREAMFVLLGSAGAVRAAAGTAPAQNLSDETVRQMMRLLGGFEPLPSEEAHVRAFLLSVRAAGPPEPEIEPALTFDPEMDP
jgi:hypothetical protein